MFSLSISASVILERDDNNANVDRAPAFGDTELPRQSTSLVTLSVVPSSNRRWSIDLLGAATVAPGETFDIRVGWNDGEYAELLGVPLTAKDTLVLDSCGRLDVYGVCEQVVLPRPSSSSRRTTAR